MRILLLALTVIVAGLGVVVLPSNSSAEVSTNSVSSTRNAWDRHEPGLSPPTITSGSFGQIFDTQLVGAIMGQPLVVGGVLVVATEQNRIYGIDPVSGQVRWHRYLGPAVQQAAEQHCADLTYAGVTSTPVYDPSTGAVYVVDKTYSAGDGSPMAFQLHAIDPRTGAERPNFPVTYGGVADNDPAWTFDPTDQTQRAGLVLSGGVVYAGFGSMCDLGDTFSGWVMGTDAATGASTARFVTEAGQKPGSDGGLWQSGSGIASDGPGSLLIVTGNGDTPSVGTPGHQPPGALGQSVVHLVSQGDGTLKATDFFAPVDAASLNPTDGDVGSGGAVVLPSFFATASAREIVATVGKNGYLYLLNGTDLGGIGTGTSGGDASLAVAGPLGGVWGDPVAWSGGGGYLYLASTSIGHTGGGTPSLQALRWTLDASGTPSLAVAATTPDQPGFGTSSPVITSSGSEPSSATLWIVWSPSGGGPTELRAYDPMPVNGTLHEVWSAPVGPIAKFLSPVTDRGRVYVGSSDGELFGFGHTARALLRASTTTLPSTIVGSTSRTTMILTSLHAATITSLSLTSDAFHLAATTTRLPARLKPSRSLYVPVTFDPTAAGDYTASLTVTTSHGSQAVTLKGSAISATGLATWQHQFLNLGTTPVAGPAATSSIALENVGATPLTIRSVSVPDAPLGLLTSLVGATIPARASTNVTFSLDTATVGQFTSPLTVTDDTGHSTTLTLLGAVGPAANISVPITSLSFGEVPIGAQKVEAIPIVNNGDTAATISDHFLALMGLDLRQLSSTPSTLAPHSATRIEVVFRPVSTTPSAAQVTINTGGAIAVNVHVTGVGVENPDVTLNIGDAQASPGQTVAYVPVELSEPSTAPVSFYVSTVDGTSRASSGAFTAISNRQFVIPPSTTRFLVPISVAPSSTASGAFTLTFNSVTGADLGSSGTVFLRTSSAHQVEFAAVGDAVGVATLDGAQSVPVPLSLAAPSSGSTTCSLSLSDGTAISANGDYATFPLRRVVIPASGTTFVTVPLPATTASFATRYFYATLSHCTGPRPVLITRATSRVTIFGP